MQLGAHVADEHRYSGPLYSCIYPYLPITAAFADTFDYQDFSGVQYDKRRGQNWLRVIFGRLRNIFRTRFEVEWKAFWQRLAACHFDQDPAETIRPTLMDRDFREG